MNPTWDLGFIIGSSVAGLGLYALAAAILLAVLLLAVRRIRDSRRRQEVWICMDCWTGFSNEAAARQHLALHQQH